MIRHILPADTPFREGETQADYMRRIAREKPPTRVPTKPCFYCGADHRFSKQFWPEEERRKHQAAYDNAAH